MTDTSKTEDQLSQQTTINLWSEFEPFPYEVANGMGAADKPATAMLTEAEDLSVSNIAKANNMSKSRAIRALIRKALRSEIDTTTKPTKADK